MANNHSVSQLIEGLRNGDDPAAHEVWRRYFEKLVQLARRKLAGVPRREADEEDIALSAMHSFLRGAAAQRFPQLENRDDLWKLLVTITARKVSTQLKRQFAEKRGGGKTRGESVFAGSGLAEVLGDEPTPQFAAEVAESCRILLEKLDEEPLRSIALLRLQGYTNDEIAQRLNMTRRSVERKLNRIRSKWDAEAAP